MALSQISALTADYSESSTFGRPGLGRSTAPHQMEISQIPHILFLLWELNIWLTRSWQIYCPPSNGNLQIPALLWEPIFTRPPVKWWFHRFLWNSYFIHTLRAQHLTDQVLAQLPPSSKAISQIPTLVWELIFGRPSVGRSTPCQMAISQIPALTAHISWQLIFHSYSESLTFGRPGLGRSTPIFWVAISLIPTLTTLISFLLWELIIWQTGSWHIYLPIQ